MHKDFFRCTQLLLVTLFVLTAQCVKADEKVDATHIPPTLSITTIKATQLLHGMPTAAAWQLASAMELVQQDPRPGEPTVYRTQVRALTDATHLYLEVTCVDPEFGKRSVHTLQRDSDQTDDDHLTIILDTFGSRRVGYVFQVNAGGARTDGLISPASGMPNFDWDGIWNAQVNETSEGWRALIVIDTRSLQFRKGADQWGFNVQRYVPRDQLKLQWAGISLDSSIFDLSRAGMLKGVGELEHNRGFEVSPYVSIHRDTAGNRGSAQVGSDIRYNFTPELTGILAINPDFAEADIDAQQINLTRFSLYLPEKRSFFLDGASQFAFAAGLNNIDNQNGLFIPFYPRRIGLSNGEPVRLDYGVKIIGQNGPWSIGALEVQTGQSRLSAPTHLFAGRLTYDVNENLRLGSIFTDGNPAGKEKNNLAGLDAVWHTSTFQGDKNLTLSGWAARTGSTGSTDSTEGTVSAAQQGRNNGWGLSADYPNELWHVTASVNLFGDALNPAMGFLPRPGTKQYDSYIEYRPRPVSESLSWARQFFYEIELQQIEDLKGNLQSRKIFTAPFNVRTQSGEHFEFDWIPESEILTAPFEMVDGLTLPIGRYHFNRYRFEAQSSNARNWQVGNVIEVGNFYNGHLSQLRPYFNWTAANGKIRLELSNETDYGRLQQGRFIQRLYQFKLNYSFSPDMWLSGFIQYDSTFAHTAVNARLRWILAPGRDFFLVANHGMVSTLSDPSARTSVMANSIVAKLRWDFHL